jgi:uncharacterized surface protein with fasciclin (FAS1) repeats
MLQQNVSALKALTLTLVGSLGLAAAGAVAAASPANTAHETIAQIASQDPSLSILVTALSDTDLVTTLEGPGPFVVFAPTNKAFESLPKEILDYFLAHPAVLKQVLLYHVAASSAPLSPAPITTVEGESVFPSFTYAPSGFTVTVNDARVNIEPIQASNGEIYVIDSVLLPQFK